MADGGTELTRTFSRPLVAVTVAVKPTPDAPTLRVEAETGFVKGTEIAGAIPMLVSPAMSEIMARDLIRAADGLLLTGGEDVEPDRYGERSAFARHVSPERDELEIRATEWALEEGVPVLAVCRGMQLLNVVLGGSLYQDLGEQTDTGIDHDRAGKEVSRAIHRLRFDDLRLLSGVFPAEEFGANSTHHQALRELGEGLVPVAWAEDGVVEAVEYRRHGYEGWVAGVQWHPERMLDERTGANRRLFERFGEAVTARARSRLAGAET